MKIFAIDPGNVRSAFVLYDAASKQIVDKGLLKNELVLKIVNKHTDLADLFAIELIQSMGMAVGQTIFDTCIWTGRFLQAWAERTSKDWVYVPRRIEKLHICGSPRAKDANIRQAIMDRYGGVRQVALGTKKNPGPLYGQQ
jgi:hypothetical protein